MPKDPVTAEEIQQAVINRIMSRQYKPGDRLPSVRDLADELGANRTTANKAYQMLADMGVIESLPGGRKGFQVKDIAHVRQNSGSDFADYFYQQATRLVWQALAAGIPPEDALEQLTGAVHEVYGMGRIHLAFYECNTHDSTEMGAYLSQALNMDIHCGVLDELYGSVESVKNQYDLIITTFHHLSEVTRELRDVTEKVVGVDTRVTPDTLLRIARLPQPNIGVVSTLQNTTHMLKHILYSYYPERNIQASTITDTEAVISLGRICDHLIVTHTCAEQVEQLTGRVPDIVVNFQVDEQSIQFLSRRIHEIQTQKTEALHLKSASAM